ncbi:MAG: hypothetical protein JO194_00550 [Candidatus Eremiobacteraeota bacterium]|nr:hypothetical protein [Candidatus Eremiobacteraeota bacterium]
MAKYVAPVFSADHHASALSDRIFSAYWGNHAVEFAWNHASLPAPQATNGELKDPLPALAVRFLKERRNQAASESTETSVAELSADQLSYVLTAALKDVQFGSVASPTSDEEQTSNYADRIIALDKAVRILMPKKGESQITSELLGQIARNAADLLPRGAPFDLSQVMTRVGRSLRSGDGNNAQFGTRIVMHWRPEINAILTQFFGDIFVYLSRRGGADSPGPIVTDFLDVLVQATSAYPQEPLVVLSHSMGGQIVYDCVTYYIPQLEKYSKLKVDFWVATGSQVSLFEEMKLFKTSDDSIRAPSKVEVPRRHLGYWYNAWDPNDLLSYTAEPIFSGVDDEKFDSNLPIHIAHFGYLTSPAFYSRLAEKVRASIAG